MAKPSFDAEGRTIVSTQDVNPGPIDFSRVQEVAEGDRGFEQQVLTVYLADADLRLKQISDAVAASDFATAILQSHNLKGASGNVGATRMRSLAESSENAARAKDAAAILDAMQKARDEIQHLRVAIDHYLR